MTGRPGPKAPAHRAKLTAILRASAARRRLSPEEHKVRERRRRRTKTLAQYGLTMAQFAAMAREQDGRCAICARKPRAALCVDHDHETGAVRALVCRNCNLVLGNARDSAKTLRSAARYVERFKGNAE